MADPLYELLLRLEHVAKLAQVGFGERLPFRFFLQGLRGFSFFFRAIHHLLPELVLVDM